MARLLRIIPHTILCLGFVALFFGSVYYVFGLPGIIVYLVLLTLFIFWWRGVFHD